MGMETRAYHFYGVHIPKEQWGAEWAYIEGERLDPIIRSVRNDAPDVGYITAGGYDQDDMLFLCISQPGVPISVPLGEFRIVTGPGLSRDLGWDVQLLKVISQTNYVNLKAGWITVPDVS